MEEWLSTTEVMTLCGWSRRRSVSRVARREGWRVQDPTLLPRHKYHYHRDDVQAYLRHRQRTALVNKWLIEKRGRGAYGLVRDARYDTTCPICGKYAVFEPLTSLGDALAIVDAAEKGASCRKTRCVEGHETSPTNEKPVK